MPWATITRRKLFLLTAYKINKCHGTITDSTASTTAMYGMTSYLRTISLVMLQTQYGMTVPDASRSRPAGVHGTIRIFLDPIFLTIILTGWKFYICKSKQRTATVFKTFVAQMKPVSSNISQMHKCLFKPSLFDTMSNDIFYKSFTPLNTPFFEADCRLWLKQLCPDDTASDKRRNGKMSCWHHENM